MDNPAYYKQMRETIARWVDLPDEAWSLLKNIFRVVPLAKHEYALAPGEKPSHVLFVSSGLLRYFSGGRRQRALNKVFLSEGMFSPPLTGCSVNLEQECGVQALEDSVVLVADAADFNELYDRHPVFDRLSRKLGEWWLEQKEARALAFQQQDAKERYLGFVRTNQDLVQRVSQIHIASYLGITEVSLSRIRRVLARPSLPAGQRAVHL